MKVKGLCWWPCQCKLLSLEGYIVCQCNNAQFSLTHGTKAAEDTNTAHLHTCITDVQIYWIKCSINVHIYTYMHTVNTLQTAALLLQSTVHLNFRDVTLNIHSTPPLWLETCPERWLSVTSPYKLHAHAQKYKPLLIYSRSTAVNNPLENLESYTTSY